MEGIFTLPYSEYDVIQQIQKGIQKQKGYSIFVPTSRQQKGIDFIIANNHKKRIVRVQVKSSRAYEDKNNLENKKKYRYNFWFNNFLDKYNPKLADLYMLYGLFPIYSNKKNIKSKTDFWDSIIIVFTNKEMEKFLRNVKIKSANKSDRFFGIGFDKVNEMYATRGFSKNKNISKHLLQNKFQSIIKRIK